MSHLRDGEIDWKSLPTALKQILHLYIKTNVHTALPGLIESYDPSTRRARVRPALRLLKTDGEPLDRPPLVNVPVVFPAGGGFTLTFPLAEGDPVLLVFSERGIASFKQSYAVSNPARGRHFALADASAIPSYGPLELTAASETGSTWQNHAGDRSIRIEPDSIEIHVGSTALVVAERGVTINGRAI